LNHNYAELIPIPSHHPLVVKVEVVPSHGEVVTVLVVEVVAVAVKVVAVADEVEATIEAELMDQLT
jgi:hypothetical protein